MNKGFLKAGHTPTLVAALLYFDVSFMAWVLLGPMAPFLRDDLGLSATGQGLLTAIPLLGGSLFRPLLGGVADRIGGRLHRPARHGPDAGAAACRLAVCAHGAALLRDRILSRHCRRELRGCAAAGQPLVSTGVSGTGDGHRRCRQFRHAAGDALRSAPRRALRLGNRLRPGDAAGRSGVRHLRADGERQSRRRGR